MAKLIYQLRKMGAPFASPFGGGRRATWDRERVCTTVLLVMEGLLLPQAVVLGGVAPFGVAFLSCFWLQRMKLPILASVAAGYVLAFGRVPVLKYLITLCLLYIFTVAYERAGRGAESRWIIPFATSLTLVCVGGAFVAMGGFLLVDIVQLISEGLLCFLASVLMLGAVPAVKNLAYDRALRPGSGGAVFLLAALTLLPIASWQMGGVSVGRALGVLLLLTVAASGAVPFATMCGTLLGLGLGLVDSRDLLLCTSYGVASMVAALMAGHSMFGSALGFVVTNGLICLYGAPPELAAAWMYEVCAASVAALFLPLGRLHKAVGKGVFTMRNPLHESKVRQLAVSRMQGLARSFREVYETVQYVSDKLRKVNFADPDTVFQTAAGKTCGACARSCDCWGKDYGSTMDNLHKLLPELRKNGTISAGQVREVMRGTCLRTEQLAKEIGNSYSRFVVRRRVSEQQALARNLECEQFIGVSGAIEQMAAEIDRQYTFDRVAEERIASYLEANGVQVLGILVLLDGDGKARVEIDLRSAVEFTLSTQAFTRKVASILEKPVENFDMQVKDGFYRIVLTQRETLHPVYYRIGRPKSGESWSGDVARVFKGDNGKLVMALADGMGSGRRASIDSEMAVRIVEKIFLSGFDGPAAMNLLNSAMALAGNEERVTAVDVTVVDLYSGRCDFIKAGAAPTYVKKKGVVHRLENRCVPTGVLDHIRPDTASLTLWENDMILMVSDGVAGEDDTFLLELLQKQDFRSPRELCEAVLVACQQRSGGVLQDDCTILAMLI
ncbi:MAG: SpoIIE family protein phosphatase [Eubacteriales bacterium]